MGVERNVCWQASTSRRFTVVNAVCEGQGDSLRKPRGWARMGRRVGGRWALGSRARGGGGRTAACPGPGPDPGPDEPRPGTGLRVNLGCITPAC